MSQSRFMTRMDSLLHKMRENRKTYPLYDCETIEAALTRIAILERDFACVTSELADMRAQVKEWLCEKCNTVYPGPPQAGLQCVICPACGGFTAPRNTIELRQIRHECDALRADARRFHVLRSAVGDAFEALLKEGTTSGRAANIAEKFKALCDAVRIPEKPNEPETNA